jgi:predicted Zn-dependent peptidase
VYADFLDNNLDRCFEILFDVATSPSFLPENIKLEKKVILEEIKMVKDNPSDDIFNYFYEIVFNGHPLSLPILGTKKTLEPLDSSTVSEYFRTNFSFENMVISAAGNIKHDDLVENVKRNIGKKRKNPDAQKEPRSDEKAEVSYIKKIKSYKGKTESSHLCLGGPGCDRKNPDRQAISLFTNILGGSISSRLFQKIREEKGLSYTIFSGNTHYTDAGVVFIYAATSTSNTVKVTDLIFKELNLIKNQGFTEEELTIAKENTKGTIVLGVEDISSRMFRLGKALLVDRKILTLDEIFKKIDDVQLKDVNRMVEKYFDPDDLSLIVISKNGNGRLK